MRLKAPDDENTIMNKYSDILITYFVGREGLQGWFTAAMLLQFRNGNNLMIAFHICPNIHTLTVSLLLCSAVVGDNFQIRPKEEDRRIDALVVVETISASKLQLLNTQDVPSVFFLATIILYCLFPFA